MEEKGSRTKLGQLRFVSKEDATAFTETIKACFSTVKARRESVSKLGPGITGKNKPPFPLMITDKRYRKEYYFITLNRENIDKWYHLLKPKPMEGQLKPLISRLEMEDSSLVNLEEVDEIYDLISRDLNKSKVNGNNDAMHKIINLPMEKRLLVIHMNAISSSFNGVHYWISILDNPKDPEHVLKLFLQHLDKQAVKRAKFIEEFIQNQGLVSLLTIQKKLKRGMFVFLFLLAMNDLLEMVMNKQYHC